MLKTTRLVLILLAIAPNLRAQAILPKGNVFVGYSYNRFNLAQGVAIQNSPNLNGYTVSGEGRIFPFLGIMADFSSYYGNGTGPGPLCPSPACSGGPFSYRIHEQNYLFGPRVSVSVGRFTPFAQALVGIGHTSSSAASDTSLASGFGGGLDWKLSGPLAWRTQVDFLHTRFFNYGQNNARVSTGLVFRF
jgi:hypothetical protein